MKNVSLFSVVLKAIVRVNLYSVEEKRDMGNTLYIGSLKSDVYFCAYEKDYEQYVSGTSLEDTKVCLW